MHWRRDTAAATAVAVSLCLYLYLTLCRHVSSLRATPATTDDTKIRAAVDSELDEASSYSIQYPKLKQREDGQLHYSFRHNEHSYEFILTPTQSLLDTNFLEFNKRHLADESHYHEISQCIYDGWSTNHKGARIGLVGCGAQKRGLMVTENHEHVLIYPLMSSSDDRHSSGAHVVRQGRFKRADSASDLFSVAEQHAVCLFGKEDLNGSRTEFSQDEVIMQLRRSARYSQLPVMKGKLTVETAVFVDDELWRYFIKLYGPKANKELLSFVIAVIHNINLLYSHPTITPKLKLKIKKYEVFKQAPAALRRSAHKNGEVEMLLDAFCTYQDKLNPHSDRDRRHWDHAFLFTGYDLYSGNVKAVAGYAPVKGMCNSVRSCTINEAKDFGCIFVATHEMGHSLGMYHDDMNGCDPNCCIMSPVVGDGKTSWSKCSVQELQSFLRKLGKSNCLLDDDDKFQLLDVDNTVLPGQLYNLDHQCRQTHGNFWRHILNTKQSMADVCLMVWCGSGEGIIRNAHPALEGTYCGNRRWCLEGKCKSWRGALPPAPVNGGWSEWNEALTPECSKCQIHHQLRIRISQRLCNKPSTNNGGKDCYGSGYRGHLCYTTKCTGPHVDQYATKLCQQWKMSFPTVLSDISMPCKIWCHMSGTSRAVSIGNFPDGTPCGAGRYCLRGECMKLQCNGKYLVATPHDCPRAQMVYAHKESSGKLTAFPQWGPWSECSVTCGPGHQHRSRSCEACSGSDCKSECQRGIASACHVGQSSRCAYHTRESRRCNTGPCNSTSNQKRLAAAWGPWSPWSQCNASGLKRRIRRCNNHKACSKPLETQDTKC